MIDEEAVNALCNQLAVTWDERERLGLLDRIDALSHRCASEKTTILRRLFSRKRIPDADAHRADVSANIRAIRALCSIQNQLAAEQEAERKKFRVDVATPWNYPEHGDLRFRAEVYVDDRRRWSTACIVTAADIDRCRIANRSLSKARTRGRKIDENIRSWEHHFRRHIERLWESGSDLSTVTILRLSEIE